MGSNDERSREEHGGRSRGRARSGSRDRRKRDRSGARRGAPGSGTRERSHAPQNRHNDFDRGRSSIRDCNGGGLGSGKMFYLLVAKYYSNSSSSKL